MIEEGEGVKIEAELLEFSEKFILDYFYQLELGLVENLSRFCGFFLANA